MTYVFGGTLNLAQSNPKPRKKIVVGLLIRRELNVQWLIGGLWLWASSCDGYVRIHASL